MTNPIRIVVPRGRAEQSISVTWSIMDHENPHPDGARRYAEALRILDELGSPQEIRGPLPAPAGAARING